YKMSIHWLINLEEGKDPPILETQPRMKAAWAHPDVHNMKVYRYKSYSFAGKSGKSVRLNYIPLAKNKHGSFVQGDYIVYGMGQTGDPAKTISNTIQAKLKPIFDTSHSMNPSVGRRQMNERAVLGYEAEGTGLMTGLEVFGALSSQVGRVMRDSK